jgi:hypothetical protein
MLSRTTIPTICHSVLWGRGNLRQGTDEAKLLLYKLEWV